MKIEPPAALSEKKQLRVRSMRVKSLSGLSASTSAIEKTSEMNDKKKIFKT